MTDRFGEFIRQWTAPSILIALGMLVFGGIVWGIQINFTLVKLVESDAITENRLGRYEDYEEIDRVNMAKITLVLDRLVREVNANKEAIAEHGKEAELWEAQDHSERTEKRQWSMKVEKIKDGPYKGKYRSRGGIIYTEDEARARYPDEFKPAVKKSAKPKRKK